MDQDTITLTPGTNSDGGFEWQMSLNGGKAQGGSYPPINVPHGHTASITFTIQNGAGQNITFAKDPMLVPPKTKGLGTPTGNGTSFTITDHNPHAVEIPYVLVFNGAPKLDPIIKNDGGGSTIFSNVALDLVGIAVVAAIVFFVLRPLFRKRGA
jgi:hypothetical protein